MESRQQGARERRPRPCLGSKPARLGDPWTSACSGCSHRYKDNTRCGCGGPGHYSHVPPARRHEFTVPAWLYGGERVLAAAPCEVKVA